MVIYAYARHIHMGDRLTEKSGTVPWVLSFGGERVPAVELLAAHFQAAGVA